MLHSILVSQGVCNKIKARGSVSAFVKGYMRSEGMLIGVTTTAVGPPDVT